MNTVDSTKRAISLSGVRVMAFLSTFVLFMTFMGGGLLLGNKAAVSIPYLIAAIALAGYISRDFFGVGPVDAMFATETEILAKRAARFPRRFKHRDGI
jgi:hypothetical protein